MYSSPRTLASHMKQNRQTDVFPASTRAARANRTKWTPNCSKRLSTVPDILPDMRHSCLSVQHVPFPCHRPPEQKDNHRCPNGRRVGRPWWNATHDSRSWMGTRRAVEPPANTICTKNTGSARCRHGRGRHAAQKRRKRFLVYSKKNEINQEPVLVLLVFFSHNFHNV